MRSLILALCLGLVANAASAFDYWNDIRNSATMPDSTVEVRLENPTGAGEVNHILFEGSGIQALEMTPLLDGPSTLSAVVPGPVAGTNYYGFRLEVLDELNLMPVRLANGSSPGPDDLTQLAPDAEGDEVFGYEHLDLLDCRVSFSDSEFHASLENAGGGFPVSQLLTFFGYLLGVADPEVSDPDTLFGLMYTYEQAGIISPGLYKITGTGLGDLQKIGEVEVTEYPEANTLVLSCQLADLMADPDFASWYDPADPALGVAGFTQRITLLGGAEEADRTPGGTCYLREFSIAAGTNDVPELSGPEIQGEGSEAAAVIDYLDLNGHCPVLAEVVFDSSLAYPMYPTTLDYGSAVTYVTDQGIAPLASGFWSSALFRFSDDLTEVVESELTQTGVDVGAGGLGQLALSVSPNPIRDSGRITLTAPPAASVTVLIYDLRGAVVRNLLDGRTDSGSITLEWDGIGRSGRRVPSGIYFLRASGAGQSEVRKLVVTR